jgi:hypothetical protein
VVQKIRDIPFLEQMTQRAYQDVIASGNYSYTHFIQWFDDIVTQHTKPNHRVIPLKISYTRMNFLSTSRFRVAYIKARNKVASGAPVRLKWRFQNRSYVISVPFYQLQYFVIVRLNSWRWWIFFRLNYWRWRLFYRLKHSLYLVWVALHMAATVPKKMVTFSHLIITNPEARQLLKRYLSSPELRRNGQFVRMLKAMAKGKVLILSA